MIRGGRSPAIMIAAVSLAALLEVEQVDVQRDQAIVVTQMVTLLLLPRVAAGQNMPRSGSMASMAARGLREVQLSSFHELEGTSLV